MNSYDTFAARLTQLWREFWESLTNPVAALYAFGFALMLVAAYQLLGFNA